MNTSKVKSVFQKIFLSITCVFLVLPIVLFNFKGKESKTEKRMLANFPQLKKDGKPNANYFGEFDSYLSDRFGLRQQLVALDNKTKIHSEKIMNDRVLIGKNGWLFYVRKTDGDNLSDFYKRNLFTKDDLDHTVKNLVARRDWCHENGIQFFVVICPNKHDVYGEFYPYKRPEGETRTEQLLAALKGENIDVIYPLDELLKNKNAYDAPIYYKTDTHWNAISASITFDFIKDELRLLFPKTNFPEYEYDINVKECNRLGNGLGDLVDFLGVATYKTDFMVDVTPRGKAWSDYYTYIKNAGSGGVIVEGKNKDLPRAIVYRDSFCTALEPFLSSQFSFAEYKWQQFTKDQKDYVLEQKPDVVIFQVVERYVPLLGQDW